MSEELYDRQPEAYRRSVLPPEAKYDLMVVSTGDAACLADPGRWTADGCLFADLRLG